MATHPIFISVPSGVSVTPAQNPVLVEAGDSLNIYLTTTSTDLLMHNITVNGVAKKEYARSTTLVLNNIQAPQFVVVREIVSQSAESIQDKGACCGIKSVKLAMQEDGSIMGTVSGLPSDVYEIMHYVMRGAPRSPLSSSGTMYRVTSWREDGPLTTLTAASVVNDTYEKLPRSAVFKTIPSDMYDMHTSGIINRSMQNPLDAPDSDIYIRSSNIYGTNGWTVQDILNTLKINARVPSGFNYHVYQLSVTRGAPVISLMHNLLPIPGLVIERATSILSEGFIASYYITVAKGTGDFKGRECKLVGGSSKTLRQDTTVIGLPGEPLYIEGEAGSNDNVTFNLVGGVFSVDYSETIIHTESII